MTYAQVYPQFNVWYDTDGTPLNNGSVYIGEAGLDPENNPITVYFDTALSIPAPQPLTTTNGYITNNGSPAPIYIPPTVTSYSLRTKNNAGTTIFNNLNVVTLAINLGYPSAPTGKVYFNESTPNNEQDYVFQNPAGINYQFFANGALANGIFADVQGNTGTFNSDVTVGGVSVRDGAILNSGTINEARLPSPITNLTITNLTLTSGTVGGNPIVGQQEGTFTPTFNGAPSASTLTGRYIRIGDKVDAFIRIEGTAAQRAALPGTDLLEIGNIPFITEFTDQTGQFVTVVEELGTYFYENTAESSGGYLDSVQDVINLWAYNESGRTLKTAAGWAAGDFSFYIHASYILN